MRTRMLAVLVAAVAISAVGCWPCCRRCGHRDRNPDRIPPAALDSLPPLPPPASPNASGAAPTVGNKPVGAYGGTQ